MRVFERKRPRGEVQASTEQVDEKEVPAYYAGTNVDDVTTWVEQMATGLSYDRVIWGRLPR